MPSMMPISIHSFGPTPQTCHARTESTRKRTMHATASFEMNTNLQPRQPPPSSIGIAGGHDSSTSLRRNESSRSILDMARDAVGSSLADELEGSYNLHDSTGGGGNGWGDFRSGGGASGAGPPKLKKQGSSNSSLGKDTDAASVQGFSTGRCFHDIAGKTNVLMEDKELYAKFQASLKEKGIKTGVGVKMALQEFVAENVSDADVARFEAAKRQKELAAGGGASISSARSLRERVGSLGGLLQGSTRSSLSSSDSAPVIIGDQAVSRNDPSANASWNFQNGAAGHGSLSRSFDPNASLQSRSFDPPPESTGMRKSESLNNLIGGALGKLGRAATGAPAAAQADDAVVGSGIMSGLRRLSGASTSSAISQLTTGDASAPGAVHRQSQRGSGVSMADAAAAVAAMDLDGDFDDSSDEEEGREIEGHLQFENLPPRAAERKRRASFGSLGALSMQKNFIDELSDEDDDESSLGSSSSKERGGRSSKPNNKNNGNDIRSRDETQYLNSDEDSDEDGELLVGFGPRPVRR